MSENLEGDIPLSSGTTPSPAPPPAGTRRPRRLRTKLLAATLALLVPLVLVELAARVFTDDPLVNAAHDFGADTSLGRAAFYESLRYPSARDPWGPPFREDADLGFSLVPGASLDMKFPEAPGGKYHVRTNALGLREDRALAEKPAGSFRVLVVGDSMTYGVGVEREAAFPALLESELARSFAPRPVEVVNVGVPCWGQWEETAFLEKRARALAPDLVILQFTVANDVLDDLRYREDDGARVPDPALGAELADHWLFGNPLASASRAYRRFVWSAGRHIVRYRAMLEPRRLARASDLIRRARDDARALGADFGLVVAPPSFQVAEGREEALLGSKRIDAAILERALVDSVAALDLAPALRAQRAAGEAGYFAVDMHWTPAGHRAVAQAIARWLPTRQK